MGEMQTNAEQEGQWLSFLGSDRVQGVVVIVVTEAGNR